MAELAFVDAGESDLPVILDIYNYYIEHSTATFRTQPILLAELQEFVFINHAKYGSYLIKDGGGRIYGFCLLTQYSKRQAYAGTGEITLYLLPGATGNGIGTLAVEHIEQVARRNHFRVLLAVITGENAASLRLFERLGYEKCAHYKAVGEIAGRILDVVAYQKLL